MHSIYYSTILSNKEGRFIKHWMLTNTEIWRETCSMATKTGLRGINSCKQTEPPQDPL